MHVDLDAFYASVEEREKPGLKGKAIVVCVYSARGGESGAVATANYEARKLKVHAGMPIARAKKLAPDAVFLPANFGFYEKVSSNIMDILRRNAAKFEQVGIDEAFIDAADKTSGDYLLAEKLAGEIKNEIKNKERLTCSIGISYNKFMAKIASGYQKPNGLTIIKPEAAVDFLASLELKDLYGIGKKTEEKLNEIGIKTVNELQKAETAELIEKFGRTAGVWLKNAALGIDEEPVEERGGREQVGRIETLAEDTRDAEVLYKKIIELSKEVIEELKKRELCFRTIIFSAVTEDLKSHTRSRTLEKACSSLEGVKDDIKELIVSFLDENELYIRRAGITFSKLAKEKGQKKLEEF